MILYELNQRKKELDEVKKGG